MKLYCQNFGCKLNLAEMQKYKTIAEQIGYRIVDDPALADLILINACHVTNNSYRKLKKYIKKIALPAKNIIVTGCLPKTFDPKKFTHKIIVCDRSKVENNLKKIYRRPLSSSLVSSSSENTRSFIKIQSGCNTRCTYCIIPQYRGSSKSVSMKEIIEKINQLHDDNYQEVVLTGTNLGQYCYRNYRLTDLIKNIIESTNMPRIRISSIDASDINDDLIQLYATYQERVCPHFHLALQSGSDKILAKMNRPYTSAQFIEKVQKIYQKIDNVQITTDVIVGFPSETKDDFKQTCKIVKEAQFLKVHIFSYSEHPETASSKIFPKTPAKEIKRRYNQLQNIAREIRKKVILKNLSKTYPVLIEKKHQDQIRGYTPNYIPVSFDCDQMAEDYQNKVVNVKLDSFKRGCIQGHIIS